MIKKLIGVCQKVRAGRQFCLKSVGMSRSRVVFGLSEGVQGTDGLNIQPLTSCVTLGKIVNLSVPQFPCLRNGNNTDTYLIDL